VLCVLLVIAQPVPAMCNIADEFCSLLHELHGIFYSYFHGRLNAMFAVCVPYVIIIIHVVVYHIDQREM